MAGTAGSAGSFFYSRSLVVEASLLLSEFGEIFIVFSVLVCLLVVFQLGTEFLFGGRGLGLILTFDSRREQLPLLANSLCDIGEGEVLWLEVFAHFCQAGLVKSDTHRLGGRIRTNELLENIT